MMHGSKMSLQLLCKFLVPRVYSNKVTILGVIFHLPYTHRLQGTLQPGPPTAGPTWKGKLQLVPGLEPGTCKRLLDQRHNWITHLPQAKAQGKESSQGQPTNIYYVLSQHATPAISLLVIGQKEHKYLQPDASGHLALLPWVPMTPSSSRQNNCNIEHRIRPNDNTVTLAQDRVSTPACSQTF